MKITRRDFMKSAAAGAASVAMLGMMGGSALAMAPTDPSQDTLQGDWLGEAPEIPEDQISQVVEADVVVIGGGMAGCAAVKSVTDQGGTAILIEKCEAVQGRSGDFGVINSAVCLEHFPDMKIEKPVEVALELMKDSGYKADFRTLKYYVDHSGEDFDWYIASTPDMPILDSITSPAPDAECWLQPERYPLPAEWKFDEEYFKCYQTTVRIYPQHNVTLQHFYDDAKASGNVVADFFYTRAVKLLTDEEGRVTGVIAHDDANDVYIQANALKGVVLATGDYSGNRAMLHYYCPETDKQMAIFSSRDINGDAANTGDGHRMGLWIGAAMERTPHAPMAHCMGGCMGTAPFLWLNKKGERFMNESVPGQQLTNQLEEQPDMMAYQIFDGDWKNQVPYMPAEHGCACYVLEDGAINSGEINNTLTNKDCFAYQEQLDSAVESGNTVKADSLEELFSQLDIDAEAALAAVARYNELAEAGEDADFGKLAKRMFPLNTPPYYASVMSPGAMLVCCAGLQSDHACRVYSNEGQVIPGLYVAGNIQGGRLKVQYPTTVPGVSHAMALTGGRLAGSNALHQV